MRKLILITALALGTTAARADNGLWYVGAGVVRNSLSVPVSFEGIPATANEGSLPVDLNNTSWKAYVGVRPLKWLAGELDYIDLGSGDYPAYAEANGKAVAAYALGFLPIPLPVVDVFGKVGLARWQLNATVYFTNSIPLRRESFEQRHGIRVGHRRASAHQDGWRAARVRGFQRAE